MKIYDQKSSQFHVRVRNAVSEGFFTFKSFCIFMDDFFKKTYKAQTWVVDMYFVYAAKAGLITSQSCQAVYRCSGRKTKA